ncbi:MAG: hypothetical protein F6K48_06680 [Okeania sp. SIO3H1]|nr:hypothetical protein [Okeania sp. SIO3H1]
MSLGKWGDGEMGGWGDGDPPLAPPPPRRGNLGRWGVWEPTPRPSPSQRGMWGDRERFGNGARMKHFWRW